jgi:hypothetical protein
MAKIKRTKVRVSISRTVQVNRFNPSTVTVEEEADVPDGMTADDVKAELYESVTKTVQKFMRKEIKKYRREDGGEDGE